ncbi:MAG TPA: hypothetical protein VIK25_14680 [Gemmatimonadaceae bacterium]
MERVVLGSWPRRGLQLPPAGEEQHHARNVADGLTEFHVERIAADGASEEADCGVIHCCSFMMGEGMDGGLRLVATPESGLSIKMPSPMYR